MSVYSELLRISDKLEAAHPGKTIVLSLKTLEPIVISDDSVEVAEKALAAQDNGEAIVFLGGPNTNSQMMGMHGQGCLSEN
jgi:hypothetical protein